MSVLDAILLVQAVICCAFGAYDFVHERNDRAGALWALSCALLIASQL